MNRPSTLNKQRIVRTVGQRTRLSNQAVAKVVEALIALLTEELAAGRRVEIENFLTLQVRVRHRRRSLTGNVLAGESETETLYTLKCRPSKHLRARMRTRGT